jgi:hypothetical protein
MRGQLAAASTSSFVHALDDILLIAAAVAFLGAAAALALIRRQDFVDASVQAGGEQSWSAERTEKVGVAA